MTTVFLVIVAFGAGWFARGIPPMRSRRGDLLGLGRSWTASRALEPIRRAWLRLRPIERTGIPAEFLGTPQGAFRIWGENRAKTAWLLVTEPQHRGGGGYSADWEWRRVKVHERNGSKCAACGTATLPLHVHHMRPLGQGGGNELANLVVLCPTCHGEEHRLIKRGAEGRYFSPGNPRTPVKLRTMTGPILAGHCIRCRDWILTDPERPLCREHYAEWAEWRNPDYRERWCHGCGKRWTTSMRRPLCDDCDDGDDF